MRAPSPSSHRTAATWLALGVVGFGLLLIAVAGGGLLPRIVAGQPVGSPTAGGPPAATAGATPAAASMASPGASPVAGTAAGSHDNGDGQPANEAISSITQRIIHTNPILARAQDPTADQPIFDPFAILTPDQTTSLTGDANRLKGAGLPTMVYIRISLNSQQQSQAFAASLIDKPGLVESRKGAQDGLVVVVSVPPGAPQRGNIAIAYGKNALPVNGLNAVSIQQIYEQGMIPRLKQGQIDPALQYGLRRFNYEIAYGPYTTPVASATARSIGRGLNVVAPLLALLGIAAMALTWFPVGACWRRPVRFGWRRWANTWWPALLASAFAAGLILLAVYARTRIGIFAAAALIATILLDIWMTVDRTKRPPARRMMVPSTQPASVAARRLAMRRREPVRRPPGRREIAE